MRITIILLFLFLSVDLYPQTNNKTKFECADPTSDRILNRSQYTVNESIDTIKIYCDSYISEHRPRRLFCQLGGRDCHYSDTLRICGFHNNNKSKPLMMAKMNYYLIVYDMDSLKEYEGQFYDMFNNGIYILYFQGKKTYEAIYKLRELPSDLNDELNCSQIVSSITYKNGKIYEKNDYKEINDGYSELTITKFKRNGKARVQKKKVIVF